MIVIALEIAGVHSRPHPSHCARAGCCTCQLLHPDTSLYDGSPGLSIDLVNAALVQQP
jgi:hypothetical protein